jgi:hypothetical protein
MPSLKQLSCVLSLLMLDLWLCGCVAVWLCGCGFVALLLTPPHGASHRINHDATPTSSTAIKRRHVKSC